MKYFFNKIAELSNQELVGGAAVGLGAYKLHGSRKNWKIKDKKYKQKIECLQKKLHFLKNKWEPVYGGKVPPGVQNIRSARLAAKLEARIAKLQNMKSMSRLKGRLLPLGLSLGAALYYTIRYVTKEMSSISDKVNYGKYVLKHKYNMIGPGRSIGVGYGTLLKHDLDKFKPKRFSLYADWFFGKKGIKGTQDKELYKRWRAEVDKHYLASPHHYHKLGKPQKMENQLEALVDWYSVNKTLGKTKNTFKSWYKSNRKTLKLTPEAVALVDRKILNA